MSAPLTEAAVQKVEVPGSTGPEDLRIKIQEFWVPLILGFWSGDILGPWTFGILGWEP